MKMDRETFSISRRRVLRTLGQGAAAGALVAAFGRPGVMVAHEGHDHDLEDRYVVIRGYELVEGRTYDEVATVVADGFIDIIREVEGFIAYYNFDLGNGALAAVSVFTDREGAEASTEAAADFVTQNFEGFFDAPPTVEEGSAGAVWEARRADEIDIATPAAEDLATAADTDLEGDDRFMIVRTFTISEGTTYEDIAELIREDFFPILEGLNGVVAYYNLPTAATEFAAVIVVTAEEDMAGFGAAASEFNAAVIPELYDGPLAILEGPAGAFEEA